MQKNGTFCTGDLLQKVFTSKTLVFMARTSSSLLVAMICAIQILSAAPGYGQGREKKLISLRYTDVPIEKVFSAIEKKADVIIMYEKTAAIKDKKVSISVSDRPVAEVMDLLLKDLSKQWSIRGKFIRIENPTAAFEPVVTSPSSKDTTKADSSITVTGKVTDVDGKPIISATVMVKGTNTGTTTNEKGEFELKGVSDNAVLVISGIGINSEEIKLNGRTSVTIRVTEKLTYLNETQIIAYGKTSRRLQTGSVSTVKAETIEKQPVGNVLNALKGAVPGLDVRQTNGTPGAAVRFNIRGLNSLSTENLNANDPLILVDGVPMSMINISGTLGGFGGYSAFNSINPNDIESIEVLKDADATAIYGSRGANGVILITTKKAKAGKTEVGVNISHGVGEVGAKTKMLSTRQYLDMRYEAFANDGVDWRANNVSAPDLKLWDTTRYTDWQKVLIGGAAKYTNAQVSLSGGNAFTSFSFSANYWRETFVYPGDFANKRVSGRFSFNHRSADDRLRFNLTALYGYDFNQYPSFSVNAAYSLPPNAPALYDADGLLNWEGGSWENPLAALYKTTDMATHNMNYSSQISYRLLKNLRIKADLGYARINNDRTELAPRTSINPFSSSVENTGQFQNTRGDSWNIEPYLEYEQKFWKGKLSVLLGTTFQERINTSSGIYARNFTDDALIRNPAAAQTVTVSNSDVLYRYSAVFGRLNYNVMDRYILNLTGRRDGSSRFGPGRQFGTFGAVGLAWIFTEEDFIRQNVAFLSFGKFRSSYGTTGSDAIGDYSFLPTYSTVLGVPASAGGRGLGPQRLYNPDYAWESNTKFDVALELGFKESDILLTANYYNNRSSNQLVGIPMPSQVGFQTLTGNLNATVQNKGWEFTLSSVNVKGRNFQWRTTANFTIPENKLLAYPDLETSTQANTYALGQSISLVKTYDFVGVNSQTGLNVYRDHNGKDTSFMTSSFFTQNDRYVMINTVPHYYGGLTNSMEYKGITLEFMIQYSKRTRNNDIATLSGIPGTGNNIPLYVFKNSWRNPGDEALFQKFTQATNTPTYRSRIQSNTDGYYTDVEILRLNNVSLSWVLPVSWQEKLHAKTARVYVQAQNLITFSNFKGVDPEAGTTALPLLRVITAGVQISF